MDTLIDLEKRFKQNNEFGDFSAPMFEFKKGDLPILFTAPHSVKTMKRSSNGGFSVKENENFTGALSLRLNQLCGVHSMVRKNYPFDCYCDPRVQYALLIRYIEDNKIKYVVDIHGASRKCNFDIAPGINHGLYISYDYRYYKTITESFKSCGIKDINFNTKFQASTSRTISSFVFNTLGIKTTQLEINRNYRDEINELEKLKMLLRALETYCEELQKTLNSSESSMLLLPKIIL